MRRRRVRAHRCRVYSADLAVMVCEDGTDMAMEDGAQMIVE